MRVTSVLATTMVVAGLAAGCAHQPKSIAGGRASNAVSSGPSTTTGPRPRASATTVPVPGGTGGASMPPSSLGPDNPQDLRGAPVVLTGRVHRTSGCVYLDTATIRWLLTGQLAAAMRDGVVATVRGRPGSPVAGCTADQILTVQHVG